MKKPSAPKKKSAKKKAPALRKRAEKMLVQQNDRLRELSSTDLKKLVHELGTHQIELEIQNEELRRAQAEIDSSRRKYADLYDFSPIGYFTFDKNGLIREANQTGAGMLGVVKRSLIARPFQNFIEPHGRAAFRDHLSEVFRTQTRQTCELTLTAKNGELVPVHLQSVGAESGAGTIDSCRTAVSDISERRRSEEALRASEERFRILTENSPDCIALHDLDLRHLYVNPSLARVAGLPQEAFIGKTVWEIGLPREVAATLDSLLRPVTGTGRSQTGEFVFPSEGGPRSYAWRSVPIVNAEGAVEAVLAIASDITERKNAEEKAGRARVEAEHHAYELALVNKELEDYSYSVSHDLRAPLRSIEGFTNAITEDCGTMLDEVCRDYFKRVVSASRRMSQLIDALLNMARLTKSDLRERSVDLSNLAEAIIHDVRKNRPERQVDISITPGLKAHGDADMLRTVLENLLDNAWKFTGKHPGGKIEFGAFERNGKTVYFVRDDGTGFDMQYADKLFHPFKRLHSESEFPGLGIGLAIAERIVTRHGGRMWAESAPEKGATFYFTLG